MHDRELQVLKTALGYYDDTTKDSILEEIRNWTGIDAEEAFDYAIKKGYIKKSGKKMFRNDLWETTKKFQTNQNFTIPKGKSVKKFVEKNFDELTSPKPKMLKARAYKLLLQLKALQAAKFQPGPNEKPDKDGNYWRTIRGRSIPFKKGESMDKIRKKGPIDYTDISRKTRKVVDKNMHRLGYSYNPKSDFLYDVTNKSDVKKLFKDLADDNDFDYKKPIYIISITNHEGRLGRRIHSAYSRTSGMTNTPLFGFWKSEDTGFQYLDVSYGDQYESEAAAIARGKHFAQESILKITADGGFRFI